jgi:hypothetical protein
MRTAKGDQAVLLQKSQPSPYYGVLMPIDYAKQLEKNSLDMALYKSELEKHEASIPLYTTPDGSTIVMVGVGAAILGFVIGAATR